MSVSTVNENSSKVQQWLDSIPDREHASVGLSDLYLNLDVTDTCTNVKLTHIKMVTREQNKEIDMQDTRGAKQDGIMLQGCQCQLNESSSKHAQAPCTNDPSVKRVTFKFSDEEDCVYKPAPKDTTWQTNARKILDEDKHALNRGMKEYLKELARKREGKQSYRSRNYVQSNSFEKETNENDIDAAGTAEDGHYGVHTDDGEKSQDDLGQDGFHDVICIGRQKKGISKANEQKKSSNIVHVSEIPHVPAARLRFPLWGSKTLQLPRKIQPNKREGEKPTIKGLVVDSATNQQPSIVRASKNANIREEHALKMRIGGYKNECCQNINTIRIAQRKLTASLAHLKTKMTEASGKRAQPAKRVDRVEMKAGHAFSGHQMAHLCFPPLVYRNRRVLTVS